MSALLDQGRQLDYQAFTSALLKTLQDPASEIKISCHSILQKISTMQPVIPLDFDSMVAPLKASIFLKTKETAVKQEIESHRALVSSALKTVIMLDAIPDSRRIQWPAMIKEISSPQSNVSLLFKELQLS